MDKKWMIMIAFFLVACSNNDTENYTGVKISPAELNENNEIIHNIFNFDKTERKMIVTTLCYDTNREVIADNDSYVMVLPPNSISGWGPRCPENTADYRIDIRNVSN